jgi:hypothetical protein
MKCENDFVDRAKKEENDYTSVLALTKTLSPPKNKR